MRSLEKIFCRIQVLATNVLGRSYSKLHFQSIHTVLYGMVMYGWIENGALNRISPAHWWPTLVSYKIFFLVTSFNYLKVLLPVLLKFMDSVKSKVN
jgi:hypothetical protein